MFFQPPRAPGPDFGSFVVLGGQEKARGYATDVWGEGRGGGRVEIGYTGPEINVQAAGETASLRNHLAVIMVCLFVCSHPRLMNWSAEEDIRSGTVIAHMQCNHKN